MKTHFIIGLLILIFTSPVTANDRNHPIPGNGILDLRGSLLDEHAIFSLNGEWEFYWKKLITPETYPAERGSGIMVNVPSYFSNYSINEVSLPGRGYGTYCLTVLLPEDYRSAICFDIPVFDVAYRFYLNERLIESNGTVGTSLEEEKPWYEPASFCLVPSGDTLRLLIQVSNFHHRRGGFWKSVYIGGPDRVLDRIERRRIYNYTTIGVLLFFSMFFFIFWFFSRKQSLMLFFALTALGMLVRAVNTGLYFSNAFIETPWSWQIRMEYLGTYMAFIFGMIFLHRVFTVRYMNAAIRVNTILFSLAIISLFLLPVRYFSYEMLLFQPLILLFLVHYLIRSLIGMFRKRIVDTVFFISLAFFIYALINDILLANSAGSINNNYLSQIAFELFIFSMAVMIIMQWVGNYNERVRLESSLRFKNKVLSVIAHDLKNPVASVAQFADLLATKPGLSGKERILQSLQESSQAAVILLDNLLYWGKNQTDELKTTPSVVDLEALIRETDSLFKHMAVQKEIDFNTEVTPGTRAYADPILVNIVIRNLVSNALKFTPRGGSVKVRVSRETELVRVSVADTGKGIGKDLLEKFAEQGHLDTTDGTEDETGTGLGLRLVKDLVEKSGGELTIESEPGKGSTFEVTLPVSKQNL